MKNGHIDWKEINRRSEKALARLNIKVDVTSTLDEYPVAIQQMVAISRALDTSATGLDTGRAYLQPRQDMRRANLFAVMRRLEDEGIGIIFITHFLDQIYSSYGPDHHSEKWRMRWDIRNLRACRGVNWSQK